MPTFRKLLLSSCRGTISHGFYHMSLFCQPTNSHRRI